MTDYYGDFPEDATVLIPFNTFTSDDPAVSSTITDLADADIKVHKDGSVTQIVTDGATVAIDFDSITGNHLVTVDTSAHADYSTGSDYAVRIEGTTIDGGTINAWIGTFSIENRFNEVTVTSMAANVVTAAAVAAAAIDNATFAADVGSTAYATNIIALAVRKALDEIKLDHLVAVADADDPVDNSIVAKLAAKGATADWSDFVNTTDSLQNIRDELVVVDGNVDDIETDTAQIGNAVGASISADIAAVKANCVSILSERFQKNSALANFQIVMTLSSDDVSPGTGLTVTGERSIDGGAFAALAGGSAITEVSNGSYDVDLAAADTNGDKIMYRFSAATANDAFVFMTFYT